MEYATTTHDCGYTLTGTEQGRSRQVTQSTSSIINTASDTNLFVHEYLSFHMRICMSLRMVPRRTSSISNHATAISNHTKVAEDRFIPQEPKNTYLLDRPISLALRRLLRPKPGNIPRWRVTIKPACAGDQSAVSGTEILLTLWNGTLAACWK